jgi:hypothetical protein
LSRVITDLAETDRVMRELQRFDKQVNAAHVDPAYIAQCAQDA